MEINGFPTSFFPPLTSLRTQANEAESAAAAARLSVSNDPPQNKADILLQSFFFVSRETPRVELNGPAAALRIVDSIDFLTRRSQTAKLPLIANLGRTSRFADLQLNSIKGIQQSLRNLSETVRNLRAAGSLNPLAARSSQASLVEASAGGNSPVSTFPVVPTQAALNAVLASNAQSSPLGPIGKSGSFIINGFQVDVISTDSLVDIKNKINLGEDRNNNGRLDRQEDINGNGSADILQATATEFGAGQFVIEDRNGSGTLDPSEDRNNNNRLDGGSAGIGVVATVEGNRLVLTGQTGAAGGIDLQDPNGLLLNLGFFELNSKGRPIPREIQFNTKEPPVNLNVSSQGATLTLDGTPLTSDTNVFKGAVKDVTLTVKQASKKNRPH